MIRRGFFIKLIKLGAFVGVSAASAKVALGDSVLVNSAKSLKNVDRAENLEIIYKFTMVRPHFYTGLSNKDILALKTLRKSFRDSGKLLSINKITDLGPADQNSTKLHVEKTFDSKQSRDQYISLFEGILARRKTVLT